MKIDIDFETMDRFALESIYNVYETLCMELLDERLHHEDRFRNEEVLDAITVLADYYERPGVASERLAKIERDVNTRMDLEKYEDMLKNMGGTDGI